MTVQLFLAAPSACSTLAWEASASARVLASWPPQDLCCSAYLGVLDVDVAGCPRVLRQLSLQVVSLRACRRLPAGKACFV